MEQKDEEDFRLVMNKSAEMENNNFLKIFFISYL